jgi:hypothetical protein
MMRQLFILCFLFASIAGLAQQPRYSGTIRVRKPADATPRIANKMGGKITPAEICNAKGIEVRQKGVRVIHYQITYFKGAMISRDVEGNQIPADICSVIKNMKNGDQVNFEQILAQDASGLKFTLMPMRFEIDNPPPAPPKINMNGFYRLKEEYVDLQRTYIKLMDDSLAFFVKSPGDPVGLNKYLSMNYKNSGKTHGTYKQKGNQITIDFDQSICEWDFVGRWETQGLIVQRRDQDGRLVAGEWRFSVIGTN